MRGYLPRLLLLAALWGSSYFFIKVGVDDVEPTVLMAGRTLLAGLILLGFVIATRGARGCGPSCARSGGRRSSTACSTPRSRSG